MLNKVVFSAKFNRPRIIDLSASGYIIVLDEKNLEIFDVSEIGGPKGANFALPEPLKRALHNAVQVESRNYAIYLNTGEKVEIYSFEMN